MTEQIGGLPADPGLDDEEAVKAAREAYDALTDDQKAKVSNYGTLTAAENSVENAKQRGKDGTFYGKGASFEAMNNNITRYANNTDPKGTEYGVLQVKSTKQTANSIGLKWKKAKNTGKYVVYGAKSERKGQVRSDRRDKECTAYNVKKGKYRSE